ncbi:cytochrome P450 [Artemisia annua]|uniref:Cytochrome P450 n=1 Tax=Artemisia annua TaxID=35608 RepID=A0A2U1KYU7_ARTAN|nr:cytochrome P450 [Artemisia annua]
MELKALTMSLLLLLLSCLLYVYFFSRGKNSKKLPPGSLGLPLIGQSFTFQKAMKDDKIGEWIQKGIVKHGPIWKACLFGSPVVVLHGTTANKFVYTCAGGKLTNTHPPSVSRILGRKSIVKMTGDNHKRLKEALFSFLKPDVLKQFVAKIDEETQNHLETHWHGRNEVQVQPLLKTLTFNVICSLVFGIERGPKRDQFLPPFKDMIRSFTAISVNLPFTQFNRGLKARKKVVALLVNLLHEKREALKEQKQQLSAHKDQDLITSLLKTQYEDSSGMMSDEMIIDNVIVLMLGGYDTISVLLTLIVK